MVGDLENRWIIFRDGWIYGLASYSTNHSALEFAAVIARGEDSPSYIVVQVDLAQHGVSPLHLLADAFSDLEFEEN